MTLDIHPDLGRKQRVGSIEDALTVVRTVWPRAWMEGSTGYQRSFWVSGSDGAELVGHCWEVRGKSGDLWLRVTG